MQSLSRMPSSQYTFTKGPNLIITVKKWFDIIPFVLYQQSFVIKT